jgi:predicted metal-dependent enzyme (double-stranded beta helix superfamily)
MPEALAIEEWVEKLKGIPEPAFTLERVHKTLCAYRVRPETLAPYLFFSRSHYTRNLIYKCPLFELLAICWDVGQVSRIHNHRDQNCWMATPIGRLRVQNFRVEQRDPVTRCCRLVPTDAYEMAPERPGAVDPGEPVHQVLNPAEFNERAVSLHIYSRPFSSCEVYSLEKGTYMDVPLFYSSEYGKLLPGEKLE